MSRRHRALILLGIAVCVLLLVMLSGCSSQERIAENTTIILKSVRGAREQLYVIAQEHPDILPRLKQVSDELMVAVDAAYAIEVDLSGVEDQHPYLDTLTTVAIYVGGAVIVAGVTFVLWKSGALVLSSRLIGKQQEAPK